MNGKWKSDHFFRIGLVFVTIAVIVFSFLVKLRIWNVLSYLIFRRIRDDSWVRMDKL